MNKKSIILIMVYFVCNSFYIEAFPALSNLESKYDGIIKTMARRYNVPPDLIHSIIKAESNYNVRAVSKKGAVGLMQLMPGTGKQYGVKDLFDPADNIEGGVKYLKDLVKLYERNTKLVLAAYNAGQEAVKKYKGIPPYPETINYIKTVQASYNKPLIRNYTKIYKYVDEKGRTVLTNDYSLYKSYIKK
jgi:soluble lytic murein transglycosylase-like protein